MYALRFIHLIRDADGVEIELRKEANCNEPSCGSSDGTNEVEIELDRESSSSQSSCSSFVGGAESNRFIFVIRSEEGSCLAQMRADAPYYNLFMNEFSK